MGARQGPRPKTRLIASLPFKAAVMFRPGRDRPDARHHVEDAAGIAQLYVVMGPVLTAMRWIAPSFVLTTEQIGLAMLEVVRRGAPKGVLEAAGHQPDCACSSIGRKPMEQNP